MNAHTLRHEAELDALLSVEQSIEARRPTRMAASTFAVWRLLDTGKAQPDAASGDSLIEIERAIATETNFGATFLIRETGTITERAVLHTYKVRRGRWLGRYVDARRVYPYVADRLCSVEVAAFVPVEPWRYAPGCDVVGRSGVVEVRHG
jgi:hypothetical protein